MNVVLKPAGQELVLMRELRAPRARVFAAWTDISQATVWWGPRDFTLLECTMDVRVGGKWYRRMRAPDGGVVVKHGVYREIVPPERLVFTYVTEDDGRLDVETVVTLTFEALGPDATRLTLRQTGFETQAGLVSHEGGWTGCLERFERFLG
jgi:uncharacterized protein YndB with AHSA1/START domain